MGLDMYLYATKYVSKSDLFEKDSPARYAEIVKTIGAEDFPQTEFGSATVDIQIGYWRKANAIHNWFVQNCQGGEDDCRKSFVSRNHLIELRDLCVSVMAEKNNKDMADEFLPTASGFFFGDTNYDEYYYEYLSNTITLLNTLLITVPEGWDFSYQSSW